MKKFPHLENPVGGSTTVDRKSVYPIHERRRPRVQQLLQSSLRLAETVFSRPEPFESGRSQRRQRQ